MDEEAEYALNTQSRGSSRASTPVKKGPQAWSCAVCTFVNPSNFSKRCDMCKTLRGPDSKDVDLIATAAQATDSTAPAVKIEPATEDAAMKSNGSESEAAQSKSSRKRKRIKAEDGADAGGDDGDDGEWNAAASAGGIGEVETTSSSSGSESDQVDAALRVEGGVHDSDDEDEDELEDAALHYEEDEDDRRRGARARAKTIRDDYEQWRYEERVDAWRQHRESEARLRDKRRAALAAEAAARAAAAAAGDDSASAGIAVAAPAVSSPLVDPDADGEELDVAFDGGYILPYFIWNKLFAYQKTCIKWLWELHSQKVGGIIADEMGYAHMHRATGASW